MKCFLVLLTLLCSDFCYSQNAKDSIIVFTAVDTLDGFITMRSSKVKYTLDEKTTVERSFFIDVPIGFRNFHYTSNVKASYYQIDYASGAKIIIERLPEKNAKKISKNALRIDYQEFLKHYKTEAGQQRFGAYTKSPIDYTQSNNLFGLARSKGVLIYYLNVGATEVAMFDRSIQSLRSKHKD